MRLNRCILLVGFIVAACVQTSALSQEIRSEDQLIAEALWAQADAGFDESNAGEILAEARRKYPESAKVAYWQGRLGVRQQGIANVRKLMMKTIESLSETVADEEIDRATRNNIAAAQLSAMQMFAETADRFEKARQAQESSSFELALIDAVCLDPKLASAWAALLESENIQLATAAADAWAAIEPDNSLPLYAKAIVQLRARPTHDSPVPLSVIEAIEEGNGRPECRVPTVPYPKRFRLHFSKPFNELFPGIAGEVVPKAIFRELVENGFHQIEAIGNWSTVSDSELRTLISVVGHESAKLPSEEEARRLRAVVGIGSHMANSNSLLFGMTLGSVERPLTRLETLATSHGDFEGARKFRKAGDHLNQTRWLVAQGYRDNPARSRPKRTSENWRETVLGAKMDSDDERATKIMQSRARPLDIPDIRFERTLNQDSPLMVRYDESFPDTDLILIDVVESKDRNLHADRHGNQLSKWLGNHAPRQATSAGELTSKELESIGIPRLEDRIAEVRRLSRENDRTLGFFFVCRNKYSQDLAYDCFFAGYRNKRDLCLIAFEDSESLSNFRQWYTDVDLRLVQILGPGELLTESDIKRVSDQADAIAVPLNRLLASDEEIPTPVVESRLPIYVIRSQDQGLQTLKKVAAGWIVEGR